MKFLNKIPKNVIFIILSLSGCAALQKTAVFVGEVTGNDILVKAAAEMSPQQEYYLGRSITAKVVSDKGLVEKKNIQAYVNFIGQYLALHSDRPDLFLGYRFAVIDEKNLSAMSAPGGFILLSRAMIELAKNEDEIAAMLAHEVAHISQKHAEKNIKNSNQLSLGKSFLSQVAKDSDKKGIKTFSEAIAAGLDISYNKDQEMEADAEAINILKKAGYAPGALKQFMERMPKNNDLMSKHPQSEARLNKITEVVGNSKVVENIIRQKRFSNNTIF